MPSPIATAVCPLCRCRAVGEFCSHGGRPYHYCPVCALVFVPPSTFLSPDAEKERYDLHQNDLEDPGYRAFLERLFVPLDNRLTRGSSGLDFGSGPTPALAALFRQAGHSMALYDPFYEPGIAVMECQYDFIAACEVLEHLREPDLELDRLWKCLRPGGWLGIMTKVAVDREAFPAWYYKNDPTHIRFYSRETFAWLAGHWGAAIEFCDNDVVLIGKH